VAFKVLLVFMAASGLAISICVVYAAAGEARLLFLDGEDEDIGSECEGSRIAGAGEDGCCADEEGFMIGSTAAAAAVVLLGETASFF